jgi:hypothetical protein
LPGDSGNFADEGEGGNATQSEFHIPFYQSSHAMARQNKAKQRNAQTLLSLLNPFYFSIIYI